MDALVIEGGSKLNGTVRVSPAKNAVLPLMAAALLAPGTSTLVRVPKLADVRTLNRLLSHLGVTPTWDGDALSLDASDVQGREAPYELVKTMRASVLVLGPLVARFGAARVSLPGGCAIGARPINLHLKGLEALGADVKLEHGYVNVTADRLRGGRIVFDLPTVTGTENLVMAASLAKGSTVIENAAREPEVVDLIDCLNAMGARISGGGTDTLRIEGVEALAPFRHDPIPDRIEAGTFLVAAAICGGEVLVEGARVGHLDAVVQKLRDAGCQVEDRDGRSAWIRGRSPTRSVDIRTSPYPGFPTDMQAQFMALMATSRGLSVIAEKVFENRFMHVPELDRMGADIKVEGSTAVVRGVKRLSGARVMATDLRASAALVLAGIAAEGTTVVSRVYHLDRGYEAIEKKLGGIGANIQRIKE
ncbi:MAG: UDP-N-acetylglucosamine 1-carboxyvinyltransferase [Deltaproteobacteria bacterium]|nr:UDP-N-acetylglucosamine 1-carboxyvinyltransferase [Deltaproteobacteria bacterium]